MWGTSYEGILNLLLFHPPQGLWFDLLQGHGSSAFGGYPAWLAGLHGCTMFLGTRLYSVGCARIFRICLNLWAEFKA